MNKVIYTAIFGDKDELKSISKASNCDYVVFTDNPQLRSNCYEVAICSPHYEDPTLNARYYKTSPHIVLPDYEYSIWIDGSIELGNIDIDALIDQYLESHDIAMHAHPLRNCIYKEAEVCIKIGKDDPAIIRQQIDWYRTQGYPEGNGLVSSGIIFRRHTQKISKLNDSWWQQILTYSRRDQLSFNYIASNMGVEYYVINGHVKSNNVNVFTIHPHKLPDFRNW